MTKKLLIMMFQKIIIACSYLYETSVNTLILAAVDICFSKIIQDNSILKILLIMEKKDKSPYSTCEPRNNHLDALSIFSKKKIDSLALNRLLS